MSKLTCAAALLLLLAAPALAAKFKGDTTLKDVQPTGTTDKKHKKQAYDLSFDAQGKNYTCRTDPKKSMNSVDFVVGSTVRYEIDGSKAKIESPAGKKVECKIVRAELISASSPY